jgi:folate-dependent phosphoribosylglycinamide formyltransferase PurN
VEKMKFILKMNIALFTSNHLRHKYIAAEIGKKLPLKLIISEKKSTAIQESSQYDAAAKKILAIHFENREISERYFFNDYQDFPCSISLIEMEFGSINNKNTLDLLEEHKIDWILLFGTSIIKPIILEKFPNKVINLHLGLSPYYRGSGTNFFPIVNNEFECIGATIHLATDNVDCGDILHQLRPDSIDENDDIHSLGNKVIEKAGKIFPIVVKEYGLGKINLFSQKELVTTNEYRLKDFTYESLEKANKIINSGGVTNYLMNKTYRLALKPIVSNYDE